MTQISVNRTNTSTVNSVAWSYVHQSVSLIDGRSVVGEGTVNNAVRPSDCASAILESVTSARIELSKHRIGRQ